jgi:hypothetical protein
MGLLDELLQTLQEASGEQPERARRRPPPPRPAPEPEPPEAKAHHEVEHDTVHRLVADTAPAQVASRPVPGDRLRRMLADPQAARDAVVLRTVLGPPLGFRGRWRRP